MMESSRRLLLGTLSGFSLLLLLSTASGHIHSPDGEVNYRTACSLARFEGYAIDPLPDGFLTRTGKDGKEYPQYGPLQPLLSVPFIWLGDVVSRLIPENWLRFQEERLWSTVSMYRAIESRWSDFPGFYPDHPDERVRRLIFSLFNPVVTWATVTLLAVWASRFRFFGKVWWILPLTYLLGTYAWPHSRPSYTEPLATFFLLISAYLAWRSWEMETPRRLYLHAASVGGFAAAALLTRLDSAVALPGILILVGGGFLKTRLDGKSKGLAIGLGAALFLVLVSWIPIQNALRFGSFLASGYEDQAEGIRFNIPLFRALWIYLLSPGKGIFGYSPPLFAALFVWPFLFRKDRTLGLAFAWVVLSYLLIIGRWQNLGGWCWGPRHLFQITPFLLFPFPFLFAPASSSPLGRGGRLMALGSIGLGVLVQIPGVLVDYMWPLDKTLRTIPAELQSQRVLGIEFYGPLLHWKTWRLDRDPDWILADLWRSGEPGARILVFVVTAALAAAAFLLVRQLVRMGAGDRTR